MEKPDPAIIPESMDDLSEEKLAELIAAVKAEIAWILEHGDKTVANMRRLRELRSTENSAVEALNEISAPVADPAEIIDRTPTAGPDDEPAEPEQPEPEPTDESSPADASDLGVEIPDSVPADLVDQITERVIASLAASTDGPEAGESGSSPEPAPEETPAPESRMMASLDGARIGGVDNITANPTTTWESISTKMRAASSTIAGWGATDDMHIMSIDHLHGLREQIGGAVLGKDKEKNSALIGARGSNPYAAPMLAALCGQKERIDIGQECFIENTSPFYDSLGGTPIPANNCGIEWRKHLDPSVFEDGVFVWDACKQDALDCDDPATWKPYAELPKDCTDYCSAEPFYVGAGLRVTVDQEFCEPDKIEEATRVIQALRRRRLEQMAMFITDSASTLKTYAMDPAKGGIVPNLRIAITNLLIRDQVGDIRCPTTFTAYVPEHLRKLVALDMGLAGELAGQADAQIRDIFAQCGINNVVFHDTWGCEGQLVTPIAEEQPEICDISCSGETVLTTDPLPCDALAFGSGTDIEAAPTQASIRLLDPNSFWKGEIGVEDWMLNKDTSNKRKNDGLYFGESRHILAPADNRRRFRLDLDALCATGNRNDRTAVVAC